MPIWAIYGTVTYPAKNDRFSGRRNRQHDSAGSGNGRGIINSNGWAWMAGAVLARIGINNMVVATFEVSSVIRVNVVDVSIIIAISGERFLTRSFGSLAHKKLTKSISQRTTCFILYIRSPPA
ncbi:MAG: hypothetical protein ACE5IR_08525 [bacterium]